MSPVQKAFLDALAVGESGGDYTILYGGSHFSDFSTFPKWEGVEVGGRVTHAAGRYQFEPMTWAGQQQKLKLSDFSPASQDAAAWDLAATVYERRIGRSLEADLSAGQLDDVALGLHTTWPSLNGKFPVRFKAALAKDSVSMPQPSSPHPIVVTGASGGLAGAVVTLLTWGASYAHVTVPSNVQDALLVLLTAAVGFAMHTSFAPARSN